MCRCPGAAAEDALAALDDLAAYSLATRDSQGQAFLVHRLVQDVTRRGLEEAGTATARLTEALGWVDAAFTGQPDDVRTWPRLIHSRSTPMPLQLTRIQPVSPILPVG